MTTPHDHAAAFPLTVDEARLFDDVCGRDHPGVSQEVAAVVSKFALACRNESGWGGQDDPMPPEGFEAMGSHVAALAYIMARRRHDDALTQAAKDAERALEEAIFLLNGARPNFRANQNRHSIDKGVQQAQAALASLRKALGK